MTGGAFLWQSELPAAPAPSVEPVASEPVAASTANAAAIAASSVPRIELRPLRIGASYRRAASVLCVGTADRAAVERGAFRV